MARPSTSDHEHEVPKIDFRPAPRASSVQPSPRKPMRPNNSDSTTGMANDVEFGLFSPPASQEEENDDDPTRTLISPPPEEELRRIGMISANKMSPLKAASKRKLPGTPTRPTMLPFGSANNENTPSQPRKQQRRRSISPSKSSSRVNYPMLVDPDSPHAWNPDADFVPPGSGRSRRSRTPVVIPPYEPPTDVFTPPRIIMSPLPPSSRRGGTKSKPKRKESKVKREILDDPDLTLPMPPASPTDDPLLLSSPPIFFRKSSAERRRVSAGVGTDEFTLPVVADEEEPEAETEPAAAPAPEPETPSVLLQAPSSDADVGYFNVLADTTAADDFSSNTSFNDDEEMPSIIDGPIPLPLFPSSLRPDSRDLPSFAQLQDHDLSLDNEHALPVTSEEGQAEYTGKFRTLMVKTKEDPPSAASKLRRDSWGNPVSPFPYLRDTGEWGSPSPRERRSISSTAEDRPKDDSMPDVANGSGRNDTEQQEADEEDEVREMSMELEPEGEEDEMYTQEHSYSVEQYHDEFVPLAGEEDEDEKDEEEQVLREMSLPLASDDEDEEEMLRNPFDFGNMQDVEDPEEREVREMSLLHDTLPIPRLELPQTPDPFNPADERQHILRAEPEDEDSDDEQLLDPEMVKITSADPRAAALAAAILKQHNYDCYTRIEAKRRHRHSVGSGGITKNRESAKRRQSVGGVRGEVAFIPGSPVMTLKGLLKRTEQEVGHESVPSSTSTHSPMPEAELSFPTLSQALLPGEWTKDHWKVIDFCFTEERLAVGGDVENVVLDKVVERFLTEVDQVGWDRDDLLRRAKALLKKQQRSSSSSRSSTPTNFPNRRSMTPSVPDFTPLSRSGRRAVLPPPIPDGPFAELEQNDDEDEDEDERARRSKYPPPSLLGPRYSHLLQEARWVERSSPTPSASTSSSHRSSVPTKSSKDVLLSYLPTLPKQQSSTIPVKRWGLPVPPPPKARDVRSPERQPIPPTSLPPVPLNHATPPPTRPRKEQVPPKRLVELQHVPTPAPAPSKTLDHASVRRRSSVKDLVQNFEANDKGKAKVSAKPVWR